METGDCIGAGELSTVRRRESGAEFFDGRLGTPGVPPDETSRQGQAREQTVKAEPTA